MWTLTTYKERIHRRMECVCVFLSTYRLGARVCRFGNSTWEGMTEICSQIHTGQKEVNESDSQKTILKIVCIYMCTYLCMLLRTLLSEIIAALLMKLI